MIVKLLIVILEEAYKVRRAMSIFSDETYIPSIRVF